MAPFLVKEKLQRWSVKQTMTRYTNNNERQQRAPKPWRRSFVFFLAAIITMWAALFTATGGYAATGTMKNVGEIAHNLNLENSVRGSNVEFWAVAQSDFSSQLSGCCGHTKDHKQMPGSCHMSCPAAWGTLSANRVLLSPARTLLVMQFVPPVDGSADSLLHQRLNRPPIAGLLA